MSDFDVFIAKDGETYECTGLNRGAYRNVRRSEKWQPARFSRNGSYETPYSVTGTVGLAGSEQAPKYICIDRIIGTWEAA